jgi:fatty acid desaturase
LAKAGDEEDKPIGELFGRLIDDGKAYAQAEIDLVRARAEDEAERAKLPAILGAGAFAFGMAAVIALVMTIVLTLASLLGPLVGGLLATLIAAAIAAGLGLSAVNRWKAPR